MSLRHILNDEPLPVHSRPPYASPRMPLADQPSYLEDSRHTPQLGSPSRSYPSQRQPREVPTNRSYYRPSVTGQHDTSWDARSGEWAAEDSLAYASEQHLLLYDQDQVISPLDPPPQLPQLDEQGVISKKRRKGGDNDAEYLPTKPRRVSFFMDAVRYAG